MRYQMNRWKVQKFSKGQSHIKVRATSIFNLHSKQYFPANSATKMYRNLFKCQRFCLIHSATYRFIGSFLKIVEMNYSRVIYNDVYINKHLISVGADIYTRNWDVQDMTLLYIQFHPLILHPGMRSHLCVWLMKYMDTRGHHRCLWE